MLPWVAFAVQFSWKMSAQDYFARLQEMEVRKTKPLLPGDVHRITKALPEAEQVWLTSPLSLTMPDFFVSGLRELEGKDIRKALDGAISTHIDQQTEGIKRQWIHMRKVMSRDHVDKPIKLLRGLLSGSQMLAASNQNPDWFQAPMEYEDAPNTYFALHLCYVDSTAFFGVKFVVLAGEDQRKHRAVFGFGNHDEFIVPSIETAFLAARQSSLGGQGKESTWREWRQKFWNWSRRRVAVLFDLSSHLEGFIREPAPEPEPEPPHYAVAGLQRDPVDRAELRLALRSAENDQQRIFAVLSVLLRAGVLLQDSGRYPDVVQRHEPQFRLSSGQRPVSVDAGSGGRPGADVAEATGSGDHRASDSDSADQLGEFGRADIATQARIMERFLVRRSSWPELYEGVPADFSRGPKGSSLLGSILSLGSKAIKTRPFRVIERVIELARQKKTTVETCRALVDLTLSGSTTRTSLEELAKDIKKNQWYNRRNPDWFFPGVTAVRHSHVLAASFMQPLGYRVFGCSGQRNLCMVRTVGFLLCVHMCRLPPYLWRVGALMSVCALVLRGDPEITSVVRVDRSVSYSLDLPAVAAINEGVNEAERIEGDEAEAIICGPLSGTNEDLLNSVFNIGLEDVVCSYFEGLGREGSSTLSLNSGFPYESLQVVPFLTGKPLVVGRTVGSLAGSNGELLVHTYNNRDSYGDKVAVYDVFRVDRDGKRSVGTYMDFQTALEKAENTPYICWWTASKEIGHLEPVLKADEFEALERGMS